MKLETFFESFAPLADAPNGVQKLRELILQLAVQGKLVPQDSKDEPAAVLLAKIKADKERLIQEKRIKKSELLPPLKPIELPFEVPQSWVWVRAIEVTSVITDGEHATPPRISQPGIPLVTAKNVRNGFLDLTTVDYVLEETAQKCWIRCDPKHDDILMVCVGATTGRLTLLKSPPRFTLVRSVALIRPMPEHVYPEFIALVINSPIGQSQVWENVKQSAQPCLYINKIQGLLFPIPPLAEQRRIVARVDQLMALCDELEVRQQRQQTARVKLSNAALEGLLTAHAPAEFAEHWQRVCDNFDLLYDAPETLSQLRQAVLQLAVQGKLVPQDAHDEPAAVLLAKIKAEKERLIQEKKIKKSEPLPPIEAGEVPFDLPKAWEWVRLDDVCHDCGQKVPNQPFTYIDVSSINKERGIISEEVKLLTAANAPSRARKLVEVGTVIYSTVRPYLLNIAIIDKAFDPEPIVSTAFAVLHPLRGLFNKFLYHYLRSKPFIEYVEAEMTGMAYPAINDTKLQKGLVPLPPLAEQRRIVAKVDQVMALCDELEAKLRQAQTASAKLMTVAVQLLAAESV